MSTNRTWPRPVRSASRIPPQIPPLVDRLIVGLVNSRKSGDEADIAEINGHGINGTENQFRQTNHFTARTLLAAFAIYGPERSCQAANCALQELGLVLSPLPEADPCDPAATLLRVAAEMGDLAREHGAAFADARLTPVELARLEGIAGQLHQVVDAYLGAARAAVRQ